MGIVHKGIPTRLALQLKEIHKLKDFVETGTLVGNTVAWATGHFENVFTIEFSKDFFTKAKGRFGHLPNTFFYLGDSRYELRKILSRAELSLIWLDAHWSRDLDYKRPEMGECPLLDEIQQINSDPRPHVIMIDDARLFTSPPPSPHRAKDWPTYEEIKSVLITGKKPRIIKIAEDVICATPIKT